MDINSILGTLLSEESLSSVSNNSGATVNEVKKVLSNALPSMLYGAANEANSEQFADSFLNAAMAHSQNDTSDVTAFFKKVDADDGSKIVDYLLGASGEDTSIKSIAAASKVSQTKTRSILGNVAPMLMSLLGQGANQSAGGSILTTIMMAALMKKLLGGGQSQSSGLLGGLLGGGQQQQQTASAGLLGSLLNGGQQQQQPASAGLLGSLLGGQQQQQTASPTGILGSLLNGGIEEEPAAAEPQGLDLGGLIGGLLGGNMSASQSAATTTTTSSTGKKKKKKKAEETAAAEEESSSGGSLLDGLMGLLK